MSEDNRPLLTLPRQTWAATGHSVDMRSPIVPGAHLAGFCHIRTGTPAFKHPCWLIKAFRV